MRRSRQELDADRLARLVRQRLIEDLDRLCSDAGLSHAALSSAARVPPSFLSRIVAGTARPSIETYAKLVAALGADLSARIYPNTGPSIRDRHQAGILEAMLEAIHPRWRRFTEVGIRKPARGWIDLVLHDDRGQLLIAGEIESTLNRIEQQVRWSREKSEALPSSSLWPTLHDPPTISRVLVVRWTRATRSAAHDAARQLRIAYPAHPDDALASLTGTERWPGPALIWASSVSGGFKLVGGR
jgi:transcriptional regulator with XRE-family HTH domain